MQPFVIQLPLSCLESWEDMLPAQHGRHCGACQKTVIDFTRQTDAEILAYFRQVADGGTCGRFRADQLGRPLVARPSPPPRRWQPWLAAVLATTLALQACDPTTHTAPRPPLAHTYRPLALDSAVAFPASAVFSDTTFSVPVPTDSLLDNQLVQGFTITPDPDLK